MRQMEAGHGCVDLGCVAGELGMSLRQLERRFQRMVGLRPKQFCRMRRFQQVFAGVDLPGGAWRRWRWIAAITIRRTW